MAIKLIGVDLDGTLLNSRKQLSPFTAHTIAQAAERGIVIAYLTGRPLCGVMPHMRHPVVQYAVTSNGAVTTRLADGHALREKYISKDAALPIARQALSMGLLVTVFVDGLGYVNSNAYPALMEDYRRHGNLPYAQASRRGADDVLALMERTTEGIENICIDTNDAAPHEALLGFAAQRDDLRPVTTKGAHGFNLELGHPQADKGLAFLHLMDSLGISRDETMAIGDDGNDLGLLRAAGTAVAMGNSVQAVLDACPLRTLSNDEDGAALAIRRIAMGEGSC